MSVFLLFQWWFQNRRRRARQLGSSRAVTSTRPTIRQHRRASPYVSPRSQQGNQIYWKRIKHLTYNFFFIKFYEILESYDSSQVRSTAGFYSDPPAVPFQSEPINYSTSESSSSSPPQSRWIAAANCPQEVTQSNYSDGFQPDQQQDYSSYYWNNREYSPPFHSSSMSHPNFYSNTDPSPCYYYPPKTTNQFYY